MQSNGGMIDRSQKMEPYTVQSFVLIDSFMIGFKSVSRFLDSAQNCFIETKPIFDYVILKEGHYSFSFLFH